MLDDSGRNPQVVKKQQQNSRLVKEYRTKFATCLLRSSHRISLVASTLRFPSHASVYNVTVTSRCHWQRLHAF
ncbi:hypothetical protein CEXT_185141 [Caerostris extrusa]|uniref:Uncharacterized protein n=1 Tax=Caerostris extrusa TaxID=172846 RepID=A0AAV4TKW8_CAEEX|nr:hypothetical protein CEXT_185141 [Caerostris extrusa]